MKVSIQRVALRDLEANPYRHIEKYQINDEKIERLLSSYAESGFWDGSIQVRPHPKKDGKYQLAFGHHRTEAARRAGLTEIGVVVGKRDNATMIRMMASENAEEFKHSPLVTQETVGAVIEAYGKGEIELDTPITGEGTRGGAQHGVYFVFADAKTKPYTLTTIARFLNWTQTDGEPTRSCRLAFEAWHAQHDLGVDVRRHQDDLRKSGDGELLTNKATEAILRAAKTARRQAERAGAPPHVVKQSAQKAASDAVSAIKEKGSARATKDDAGRVGHGAAQKVLGKAGIRRDKDEPPDLPVFVAKTTDVIRDRALSFIAEVQERVDAILPYRDQLDDAFRDGLVKALRKAAEEVALALNRRADTLEHRRTRTVSPPPRRRLTA